MMVYVFIWNIKESSSNEAKNQETYFSNQDILTSLNEIQRQLVKQVFKNNVTL